ncbi:restriction endonuclease subunit S [Leptospira levettii]|uniref:restriction endonuclease subunit S n=1 Tax=Leptospira levettii TaxID=2023178 RepID=UPI000C2B52D0|nr:restriction endonuclease subunit S [Leptospira levettii]PJZ89070.1 hypothetical protein CH368_08575 [Leptospira levettii]
MKPYPKYKDSGVEWIGVIPEGWIICPLKRTDGVIMGQSPDSSTYNVEGQGIPFLQGNAEFGEKFPIAKNWSTFAPKKSKKSDILLSVRAPVGEVNISNIEYGIGRGLCAIRSKDHEYHYLFFGIISANNVLNSYATGSTFSAISAEDVRELSFPLPPLAEQKAIATFLDRETTKIDTLIAKQEQLIALLEEKRQALISHAVTKGLDPNAKMKDSGVEWLGEIPEGWEVKRLKYICKINPSKSEINNIPKKLKVTFLPMEMVSENGLLNIEKEKVLEEVYQGFTYFKNSDVLVAKITPCFENGKGAVCKDLTNGIGFGSTEFHVLRPTKNSHESFIFYITRLYHFRNFGESEMRGSAGQKRVTPEFLQNYELGIPSLLDQKAIVDYLDRQTEKLDLVKEKAQSTIELLKEKRSALISSAVTGKIDVREMV